MRRSRLFTAALLAAMILSAAIAGPGFGASTAPGRFIVTFAEAAVGQAPAPAASAATSATDISHDGDDDDDDDRRPRVDGRRVKSRVADLESRHRFKASNVYQALGGFAAELNAKQLRALQSDAAVDSVVPDVRITLDDPEAAESGVAATGISLASPRIPAGVRRVGATSSPTAGINGSDQRVNADVAVLDTGIQGSHPDLNVVGGYNCTSSDRNAWADGNGHGTHVAGTVGALDNGRGVVGVAPGARLWSVKVLNAAGSGYQSWLVCGIDWVTAQRDATSAHGQRIEVANMSLRFSLAGSDDRDCGIPSGDAVHRAICRSVDEGVTYAVAAGNEGRNARVYRPAAYDEVITVSAIVDYDGRPGGLARQADYCGFFSADADDTFADFSNYGADMDITAPGKCVLSTFPGSRYAYMSGTSMATPHVAGAAALYVAQYRSAAPQQVKMALQHAGRLDWRTSTDPDGRPERALWVASYSPPPDFSMTLSTASASVNPGGSVSLAVRLVRQNGHNAPVSMSLRGAPAGVTLSGGPFRGTGGTISLNVASTTLAGRYVVDVRGSDGELARRRSIELVIAGGAPPPPLAYAPVVGRPTVNLPSGGTVSQSGAAAVDVAWTATVTGATVTRHELRVSSNGGAWASVALANPATPRGRMTLPQGTHVVAARAQASNGTWSAWVSSRVFSTVVRQADAATFRGTWQSESRSEASGGLVRYSTSAGATSRFSFTGSSVALVSSTLPDRGQAQLFVDGVQVAVVDLRASSTTYRKVVFSRTWSSVGAHVLEVRVVGTTGRPRVDVDAFIVIGAP